MMKKKDKKTFHAFQSIYSSEESKIRQEQEHHDHHHQEDIARIHISFPHEPKIKEKPSALSLGKPFYSGWLERLTTNMCRNTWIKRFFIVSGGYVFKYSSPTGAKPKGSPLGLFDSNIDYVFDYTNKHSFRIWTFNKEYILSGDSEDTVRQWVEALRKAKLLAVKQAMGHLPMTKDEQFAQQSGDYLVNKTIQKEREKSEEPSIPQPIF